MSICPKDLRPCCDDLCYSGGCIQMDGYPMLQQCHVCGGLVDEENPDLATCKCDWGDDYDDEPFEQARP